MKAAAVILCAASCAACIGALQLLSARGDAAVKWPLVVPLLAPPLLIAYGAWALLPTAQQSISVTAVALALGLPLLALSLAPWPSMIERAQRIDRQRAANESKFAQQLAAEREAKRQEKLARMATFTDATPLWEWLGLIDRDSPVREDAITRIRALPRRQADAGADARARRDRAAARGRGDRPAGDAGTLRKRTHLSARERATNLRLRRRSGAIYRCRRTHRDVPPFRLERLKAKGCDCGSEIAKIDGAVRAYPDSPERRQFLDRLARLHSISARARARFLPYELIL